MFRINGLFLRNATIQYRRSLGRPAAFTPTSTYALTAVRALSTQPTPPSELTSMEGKQAAETASAASVLSKPSLAARKWHIIGGVLGRGLGTTALWGTSGLVGTKLLLMYALKAGLLVHTPGAFITYALLGLGTSAAGLIGALRGSTSAVEYVLVRENVLRDMLQETIKAMDIEDDIKTFLARGEVKQVARMLQSRVLGDILEERGFVPTVIRQSLSFAFPEQETLMQEINAGLKKVKRIISGGIVAKTNALRSTFTGMGIGFYTALVLTFYGLDHMLPTVDGLKESVRNLPGIRHTIGWIGSGKEKVQELKGTVVDTLQNSKETARGYYETGKDRIQSLGNGASQGAEGGSEAGATWRDKLSSVWGKKDGSDSQGTPMPSGAVNDSSLSSGEKGGVWGQWKDKATSVWNRGGKEE